MFAADLGHSGAALRLTQGPQDLLFRMSLLQHLRVLLVLVHRTTLAASNSTYRWLVFRVLGQGARAIPDESGKPSVGFTFSEEPDPDDWEFEQEGLRIFVEGALVEPLDGRTLDVRDANDGLQLAFR